MFTDNNPIYRAATVWADVSQPVTRRIYVTHGVSLAAIKYLGDVLLVYVASGTLWTPSGYVHTMSALFVPLPAHPNPWLLPALVIWMLPFVALGVTLTARRAMDAGRSPWLSILFLVPLANYALMATLSAWPSRRPGSGRPATAPSRMTEPTARALSGAAGILVALLTGGLVVSTIRFYGGWLFLLTPFAMGSCTAFLYNRGRKVTSHDTMSLVLHTTLLAGAALLLFAFEGIVCLLMSLPITIPLALLGGTVGRWAATLAQGQATPATFMLLALPLAGVIEPATGRDVHEVRSSVIINAAPDVVWQHVVAFREITEPSDWVFRAGVAYPVRARIEGSGIGAVRYCEFSTGAFVEPITGWEPGRRLSFDVVQSPAPLRELSPYRDLSPPHLDGYLRAKRGEFRLVDLPDGKTRLEGSTWYEIHMAPETYWQIFSDALIHRIHRRVLDHVKKEVELRHPRR